MNMRLTLSMKLQLSDQPWLQEKKGKVLSFRVGDNIILRLSSLSAGAKRLSPARAARQIVEEFLNGHLLPPSEVRQRQTKPQSDNETAYV